jgi:hypothetical protein
MSELPDGWVPIASYDERADKRSGGPVGAYRMLLVAAKRGDIAVMQQRGSPRKYVVKEEADEYVRKWQQGHVAQAKPEASAPTVCQSQDACLLRIAVALEKIADTLWTRS